MVPKNLGFSHKTEPNTTSIEIHSFETGVYRNPLNTLFKAIEVVLRV
jgi:hypothetical protein